MPYKIVRNQEAFYMLSVYWGPGVPNKFGVWSKSFQNNMILIFKIKVLFTEKIIQFTKVMQYLPCHVSRN